MHITPKSPEQLAAQAADYASQLPIQAEAQPIYHSLGDIAVGETPSNLEAAHNEDYVDHVRRAGGIKAEAIHGRAELLQEYDAFIPDVTDLKQSLAEYKDKSEHPAYVGSGLTSQVFKIEKNGNEYAVRVPRGDHTVNYKYAGAADGYAAALLQARGVPGLEQVVAYSHKDGTTISEFIPGYTARNIPAEDLDTLSTDQIEAAFITLEEMQKRDLLFDPKPSNVIYDPEKGVHIIDFLLPRDNIDPQTIEQKMKWLLNDLLLYQRPGYTPQAFQQERRHKEAVQRFLARTRPVAVAHGDRAEIEQWFDMMQSKTHTDLENLQNPQWVHNEIQAFHVRNQERLARQKLQTGGKHPVALELDIV